MHSSQLIFLNLDVGWLPLPFQPLFDCVTGRVRRLLTPRSFGRVDLKRGVESPSGNTARMAHTGTYQMAPFLLPYVMTRHVWHTRDPTKWRLSCCLNNPIGCFNNPIGCSNNPIGCSFTDGMRTLSRGVRGYTRLVLAFSFLVVCSSSACNCSAAAST